MATTVTYKNNTLVTVNNQTKTLKTAGKFLEDDITLVDISGGTAAISVVDTADAAGGTVRTITALDISDTTAVAGDVAQGKYFYTADGTKTAGTASGSGGGQSVSPKQVNFIDYDGSILYSYTAQEANALSALPANPSHSGLTAQGWNWTLAQIKAQLAAMPDGPVWVGQMYITQSGDTEIDVRMPEGRLSPILTIAVNGSVTVDWGDNTTANTVTGSSLSTRQAPSHTYAAPGDYTIKIHVTSGSFLFYCDTSYLILRKNTSQTENRVYANCVQAVRLGSGITLINEYAFYYCANLAYVTIPDAVTSIGGWAFENCVSLASLTIPSSVNTISNYYAFGYCYGLASISIPSTVTSIGDRGAFYYCYAIASLTIPSSVRNITRDTFGYCYGLASISIPSTVTSIGNSAFNSCSGLAEIHILPTSVPTLGTTVFNSIASDCVIYVPSASLDSYKTANNWSTYASYMQGE